MVDFRSVEALIHRFQTHFPTEEIFEIVITQPRSTVLPNEFAAQNLAFILTEGSPLRDKIIRAPLSERAQWEWRE